MFDGMGPSNKIVYYVLPFGSLIMITNSNILVVIIRLAVKLNTKQAVRSSFIY